MDPDKRSAWLQKLDEECPYQLVLPRRQLTDDMRKNPGREAGAFSFLSQSQIVSVLCCWSRACAARRFPPPWSVEELDACFIVKDGSRQKLAYVYFEEEPGRPSRAKLLTKNEARPDCGEYRQAAELLSRSDQAAFNF